jgi:hypothetical protein
VEDLIFTAEEQNDQNLRDKALSIEKRHNLIAEKFIIKPEIVEKIQGMKEFTYSENPFFKLDSLSNLLSLPKTRLSKILGNSRRGPS